MRVATTLFLFVLTAGVTAFILLKERGLPGGGDVARGGLQVPSFEVGEAVGIRLVSPRLQFTLRREEGGVWALEGDIEGRADPEWVADLLREVASLEVIDRLEGGDIAFAGVDAGETGIGQGSSNLFVELDSGSSFGLAIGAGGAFDGTAYLAAPGSSAPIYLARTRLHEVVDAEVSSMRDPRLWDGDPESLGAIEIVSPEGEVALGRASADELWQLERPLQTAANEEVISGLLGQIMAARIQSYPEDDGSSPPEPDPEEVLELKLGRLGEDGERCSFTFWKGAKDEGAAAGASLYMRSSLLPHVVEVDAGLWEVLQLKPNDLRNPTLARLNTDVIGEVRIEGAGGLVVDLRKEGRGWMMHRSGRRARANGGRVDRLFKAINEQEILEFVSDSASSLEEYGLEKPFLSVSLRAAGDDRGETLSLGQGEKAIYARWQSDPFVYRVSAELLSSIPMDPVKWKDLTVLQFSIFALRAVRISPGPDPPIELDYDYQSGRWGGRRAGEDISDMVDPARAEALAAQLGSLRAADWITDGAVGFSALKEPELVVDVSLQRTEADGSTGEAVDLQLSFAAAGESAGRPSFYYGSVGGVPEVFLVRREVVDLLSSPPFKED